MPSHGSEHDFHVVAFGHISKMLSYDRFFISFYFHFCSRSPKSCVHSHPRLPLSLPITLIVCSLLFSFTLASLLIFFFFCVLYEPLANEKNTWDQYIPAFNVACICMCMWVYERAMEAVRWPFGIYNPFILLSMLVVYTSFNNLKAPLNVCYYRFFSSSCAFHSHPFFFLFHFIASSSSANINETISRFVSLKTSQPQLTMTTLLHETEQRCSRRKYWKYQYNF